MTIFLHFFLWNLNHVFNSSSKIGKSVSLGNQMVNHAIVNKPLYFVTSCVLHACLYKEVASLV